MKKFFTVFDLWLSGLLLAFMATLLFYEVVMRYVFNSSSAVITELCSLAFIWFIYLSMSHVTGKREHITIEIADIFLPKSWMKYIMLLSDVIMLLFMIFMTVSGVRLVKSVMRFHFATPVLEISMIIPYSIIPFAFAVMAVKMCLLLAEDVRKLSAGEEGKRHA